VSGDRQKLQPERTSLAQALIQVGLPFYTRDFSADTHSHLQRKRRIAEALRPNFEAEANLALYDYILAESDPSDTPFDPQTCAITRYLYCVQIAAHTDMDHAK
jgi:hypothetical protein